MELLEITRNNLETIESLESKIIETMKAIESNEDVRIIYL